MTVLTKVSWMVPTSYDTPENEALKFDLTEALQTILSNSPWNRDIEYGDKECLKQFTAASVHSAKFTLLRSRQAINYNPRDRILEHFHADALSEALIRDSCLEQPQYGYAVMEAELEASEDTPSSCYKAIVQELGALFRAAVHLSSRAELDFVPNVTDEELESAKAGLLQINSDTVRARVSKTSNFTVPINFGEADLNEFNSLLHALASKWHLNLWPLYRLCKSTTSEYVVMDDFLELMFAFEGLFDKRVSTDFMHVAVMTLLANSRGEAAKYQQTLQTAFEKRNDAVHGGIEFSGFEPLKKGLNGRSKATTQDLFWSLKHIVSRMMIIALEKLTSHPDRRNLRIGMNDLVEKIHEH